MEGGIPFPPTIFYGRIHKLSNWDYKHPVILLFLYFSILLGYYHILNTESRPATHDMFTFILVDLLGLLKISAEIHMGLALPFAIFGTFTAMTTHCNYRNIN